MWRKIVSWVRYAISVIKNYILRPPIKETKPKKPTGPKPPEEPVTIIVPPPAPPDDPPEEWKYPSPVSDPIIFTTETLFHNPTREINSLQKKVLEILFTKLNLSVQEDEIYVAYFPSRLLSYLKKQDAFSAFRRFLGDIGRTPKEVFNNKATVTFVRDAILGLYEADINCWDTTLTTEPLYLNLRDSNVDDGLDSFTNLVRRLETFAIFAHKLQRIADKIPFKSFQNFCQEVALNLKFWNTISQPVFDKWNYSLGEYQSQFTNYQHFSQQIDHDLSRLKRLTITLEETYVIEHLLEEVRQLKEAIEVGSIEIDVGLDNLNILADEIQGFVDEVLHRCEDAGSSRTEDDPFTDDKLALEEALTLLDLTVATLSMKSLKTSRNRYARLYHPDIGGDETMMKKINAAYEILKEYLETRHI